jgi:hypothetical protein
VGTVVGVSVGVPVGANDGLLVEGGRVLGSSVGVADGLDVGTSVGTSVGAIVATGASVIAGICTGAPKTFAEAVATGFPEHRLHGDARLRTQHLKACEHCLALWNEKMHFFQVAWHDLYRSEERGAAIASEHFEVPGNTMVGALETSVFKVWIEGWTCSMVEVRSQIVPMTVSIRSSSSW